MRLIGAAAAAVAAWVWFSRRRRTPTPAPAAVVSVPPTEPHPQQVPAAAPEPVATEPVETAPRLNGTGRLDASAGWDDLDGKPASTVAAAPQEARTPAPGLPGDDAHGVPTWDRPA